MKAFKRICLMLLIKFCMNKDYLQFKKIETGPIVKDDEIIGYYFYEQNDVIYVVDDEDVILTCSRWAISPDGEYLLTTERRRFYRDEEEPEESEESENTWGTWDTTESGVFDSSRYEEYVEQMKNFRTDWKKGLKRTPWVIPSPTYADVKDSEIPF